MNNRQDAFAILPKEILNEITSHLPYDNALLRLAKTSRYWRNIVQATDSGELARKFKKLQPSRLNAYFYGKNIDYNHIDMANLPSCFPFLCMATCSAATFIQRIFSDAAVTTTMTTTVGAALGSFAIGYTLPTVTAAISSVPAAISSVLAIGNAAPTVAATIHSITNIAANTSFTGVSSVANDLILSAFATTGGIVGGSAISVTLHQLSLFARSNNAYVDHLRQQRETIREQLKHPYSAKK